MLDWLHIVFEIEEQSRRFMKALIFFFLNSPDKSNPTERDWLIFCFYFCHSPALKSGEAYLSERRHLSLVY
jgi:hypothetical protein